MNYLTKQQYANAKRALTRIVNQGDQKAIIDHVDSVFEAWDDGGYAWPDDWTRWQRARDDAVTRYRLEGKGW